MPEIAYRLSITLPHTHRVQIEMIVPPLPGPLDLAIPAWMPGAYKLVDHARNVRGVAAWPLEPDSNPAAARDPASSQGEPTAPDPSPDRPVTRIGALAVERLDMHTWRVHGAQSGAIVRYDVFADKLMIHEGQVNADHAFLNGSALWLGVQSARHLPCRVQIDAPEGWQVVSALDREGQQWLAADFDTLVDAPLEAGNFAHATVDAADVSWEIVWHGAPPIRDLISQSIPAIAREAVNLFGPAPFSRYVMYFHDCAEPGFLNGLEHRTSMAMQGPLDVLGHPTPFFTMVAHEILHAWNGQRMAPTGLFRPGCDYFRPAHTTALWVVEGWTEYFASLLLLRAGQIDPQTYLAHLAETFDAFYRTPGRKCTTLEESSFITWNFGDDRWNGAINYYLKGLLAAFALDVEIRVNTAGKRSLDDVARALWREHGDRRAYDPSDVERIAAEVGGLDLADFFDTHLRSTQDPDYTAIAAKIGLTLTSTARAALGLRAAGPDGALKVEGIEAFGPAENAGLQVGDVLQSLAPYDPATNLPAASGTITAELQPITEAQLAAIGKEFQPGELLVARFLRGEATQQTTLKLGAALRHLLAPTAEPHPLLASYLVQTQSKAPAAV